MLVTPHFLSAAPDYPRVCISAQEKALYKAVNDYRRSLGLSAIPLSTALLKVAQTHVNDLVINNPDTGICNLHSWSNKGSWSPCCYTSDHAKATGMWNKPRELTDYQGSGFEISFWSSSPFNIVDDAMRGWESSSGHLDVISNRGNWSNITWKAMGVGIRDGYACIWFGMVSDPSPQPASCLP